MAANNTLKALAIALQARVPVVLIGGPGSGKTANIRAIYKALGWYGETIIASLREPTDFAGLPIVDNEQVTLSPPSFAKRLIAAAKEGGTIAFFDEISCAAPATQAALLRVIHERVVGDLALDPSTAIVAAMNPPEQSAGGSDLTPPMANRFCHLPYPINTQDWVNGMIYGWEEPDIPRLPKDWESYKKQAYLEVASFIQHKQTSLYSYPKSESEAGKAWPSPRTWEMAATLSAACKAAGVGLEVEIPLISGCVGDGNALEFTNWREALDLPDPEDLLKNPEKFEVPERGDRAYTILSSVATAVCSNMTKARYMAAWTIFGKAAASGKKDTAAGAVMQFAIASNKEKYMADPKVREAMKGHLAPFQDILLKAGIRHA